MKRNKCEQIRDLLRTVAKYPSYPITRISAIAGINPSDTKEIFNYLVTFGFLKEKEYHKFLLTKKGYDWEKQYSALENEMLQSTKVFPEVNLLSSRGTKCRTST